MPILDLALGRPSTNARAKGVRALYPGGPLMAIPDARTGLQRAILRGLFGDNGDTGLEPLHRMVALHWLKDERIMSERWEQAQRGQKEEGRGEWKVPEEMMDLVSSGSL